MIYLRRTIVLIFGLLIFFGCTNDKEVVERQLILRIESEPDRLNPITSRGATASQIENFIFQPLGELDPVTLKFEPVLLEKVNKAVRDEMPGIGAVDRLDIRIKSDANWTDGRPVTYEDVLFTLKAMLNDDVGVGSKKAHFAMILAENHDENDQKFLSFYLDTAVFNADIIAMNFHIMPKHVYDSSGYMNNITLHQLVNNNFSDEDRSNLKKFADQFLSDYYSRRKIIGSGAYEIQYWNTGYEILLRKKVNWWGDNFKSSNLFKAKPEELLYKVIPDQQLAITAMKNDNVDVIGGVTPEKFSALRETQGDEFQFLTPVVPRYIYIILNNEKEELADRRVRQALAYLVDQQTIIETVMGGYASTLTAPLLPRSAAYNDNIQPYAFNPEKARNLLAEAGWEDLDDDGFVYKKTDDERKKLQIILNITGSETGRQIALLLKENFKQAGVELIIEVQKFSKTIEDMRAGNFDAVATAASQSLHEANLRPTWHSSGIGNGGGNYSRTSNPSIDEILDMLEDEETPNKRIELYHKFHELIHEETPVLFLFMPTERVLVSKKWKLNPSPRRPGYFENLAEYIPSN